LAKAAPGHLSYASGGPGSPHHLYAELFKSMTGIELTHVPYKGSAPAVTDVVAGHVPIHFSDPVASLPLVREGKLRALGVTTTIRMPSAPDIPPIAETGVAGFDASSWIMIVAPAKTPKEIVAKLREALLKVLDQPSTRQSFERLGAEVVKSTPEEFARRLQADYTKWVRIRKETGIKVD